MPALRDRRRVDLAREVVLAERDVRRGEQEIGARELLGGRMLVALDAVEIRSQLEQRVLLDVDGVRRRVDDRVDQRVRSASDQPVVVQPEGR